MAHKLRPILIVPDCHRPYHDERAWQLMLKVARVLKPHYLVLIGDLADFYAVSNHSRDPRRKRNLEWEVESVEKGLDQLDSLDADEKVFIAGNHESRLTRYLQDRAPELFNVVSIPGLLNLKERGWKYVPYKSNHKIGKLHLTHDVGSAGRYAAFKALDTFQYTNVTGHTHRFQYIVEGNAVGEQKLSAQFGWLGDAEQIDYMHSALVKKNWALGFGAGYIQPDTGIAYLVPVPIVGYTCLWNGKVYTG